LWKKRGRLEVMSWVPWNLCIAEDCSKFEYPTLLRNEKDILRLPGEFNRPLSQNTVKHLP
jgi:hypothetical protein